MAATSDPSAAASTALLLLGSVLLTSGTAAPVAGAELPEVVFNTRCSRCHEAECSGRLSFGGLPEGFADNHIRQFAGPLPKGVLRELQQMLEYTKRHCTVAAPRLPVPSDRRWDAPTLARLGLRDRAGYFVPLGILDPGEWRLTLTAAAAAEARAEVIGSDFGRAFDNVVYLQGSTASTLYFRVDCRQAHYLRIATTRSVDLLEAVLVTVP